MSLTELPIRPDGAPLPDAVEALVQDAEHSIDSFLDKSRALAIPAFVPSDFRAVYRALQWLVHEQLATGRRFCEWGSGFGVVASLAALLDLQSCGIEVEPSLVKAAKDLARRHSLSVEFVCGTFVPDTHQHLLDAIEDFYWLADEGACGYELLYTEPDEFDMIFAYPWPGEEHVITSLFEEIAPYGTLLITYRGRDGVLVQRKG